MHAVLLPNPELTMPGTQTHWLTLDAPVPLVVRPAGQGLHVAWSAKLA